MEIQNFLQEKRFEGISKGSAEWFRVQREIILSRPLIKKNYDTWYSKLLSDEKSVPKNLPGKLLEIGSGGGYLKKFIPDVITSDVVPQVADMVLDAQSIPFPDNSLRAVFLINSFHHFPDVENFLREINKKLIPQGVISIIEPAATLFARFFFSHFHPEQFSPHAQNWAFDSSHHMESANQALSWIVFFRDQEKFKQLFPQLKVECAEFLPWFSYLLAGGVTRKNLVPNFAAPLIKFMDILLKPADFIFSLNWHIRIRKVG